MNVAIPFYLRGDVIGVVISAAQVGGVRYLRTAGHFQPNEKERKETKNTTFFSTLQTNNMRMYWG